MLFDRFFKLDRTIICACKPIKNVNKQNVNSNRFQMQKLLFDTVNIKRKILNNRRNKPQSNRHIIRILHLLIRYTYSTKVIEYDTTKIYSCEHIL